jgi:hypothetical protein
LRHYSSSLLAAKSLIDRNTPNKFACFGEGFLKEED